MNAGTKLVRIRCGDAARLGVDDRATGRLFDVGERFDNWLHGDAPPGAPIVDWIAGTVDDFSRDELIQTGPRDYLLPESR
ncbi:hypothetical protein [Nocardia xishanensis]|uniref:Uncharacterized protein n=1 Tax=Nocardia xishanensis TaxID=238964 RepID=A0ABW7XCP8_9NOCA